MSIDLRHYHAAETLRDGQPVTLRAPRPDDRERVRRAFHELDPESVYTRLFRFKKELTADELTRLTEPDFDRHITLLVTIGDGDDPTAIAAANCVVIDPPQQPATRVEVAFTVEEDYQGQGLATMLLRHLIAIARDRGLTHLEAEVLASNTPMLKVFARSGLPTTQRRDGGVLHLEMALAPAVP
jgi:RimJ/RimL family protein N-acetyltransferase